MRLLVLSLACFGLAIVAGCALFVEATRYSLGGMGARSYVYAQQPPDRFQHDGAYYIRLDRDASAICRDIAPDLIGAEGCARIGDNQIWLPNPCEGRFRGEQFADLACHEVGHANGWAANHLGE